MFVGDGHAEPVSTDRAQDGLCLAGERLPCRCDIHGFLQMGPFRTLLRALYYF